jgi:hypothetical protein
VRIRRTTDFQKALFIDNSNLRFVHDNSFVLRMQCSLATPAADFDTIRRIGSMFSELDRLLVGLES